MKAVEVGHVTRDVEGHDLPSSIPRDLRGAGHPFGEKKASGGLIAFAHDYIVSLDHGWLDADAADGRPLRLGQLKGAFQAGEKRVKGLQQRHLLAARAGAVR